MRRLPCPPHWLVVLAWALGSVCATLDLLYALAMEDYVTSQRGSASTTAEWINVGVGIGSCLLAPAALSWLRAMALRQRASAPPTDE